MTVVRSVVVALRADISDFLSKTAAATAAARGIPDGLSTSAAKARTELSSLEVELAKIAATRYDATVLLEDADAARRLDELNARLDRFGAEVADARVDVDDAEASGKLSGIEARLLALAGTTASPEIDLQGIAAAEAQLAALQTQLRVLGSEDVNLDVDSTGLRGFIRGLNDSNDRMSNLIQTGVALGPALIPTLAGAAVAGTSLATSLTFAAAGGAVLVGALHGVGGALDALNKYQLDPTQANLDALRTKLEGLGPAGQHFVFFLDSLQPKLQQLQDTAEAGFLPGLETGIDQVMHQFPIVNQLVGELSATLGGLAVEAGDALTSPFWTRFLQDFTSNASTALSTMSEGIGNIITGLAGMFQAFEPVGTDFNQFLLGLSQDFSRWGQGLANNPGFHQFIDYARENGPLVADALGAISDALVAVVEAGAPVGHALLPVITLMAQGFAAIARSPIGPVLFGVASGAAALARSMALLRALNVSTIFEGIAALGGPGVTAGTVRLRALGAGVAVLALSLTSLDDSLGLSNVATFAATGSIFGAGGVAIGAGVGLLKDMRDATNSLSTALDHLNQAKSDNPFDFSAQLAEGRQALQQIQQTQAEAVGSSAGFGSVPGMGLLSAAWDHIAGSAAHAADEAGNYNAMSSIAQSNAAEFIQTLQGGTHADALKSLNDELPGIVDNLQKLGYSGQQIQDLFLSGAGWDKAVSDLQAYAAASQSVPGRTQAVATAISGLRAPLTDATSAADALKQSLDALFAPELARSEAIDQMAQDLHDLADNLKGVALFGQTDAARNNRGFIRGLVSDFEAIASAGPAAGESLQHFGRRLQDAYQSIIATGKAADLSVPSLQKLLATYNLTPHTVRTILEAVGVDVATEQAKDLTARYNNLPADVRTNIATNGFPETKTQIDTLQREYDLTPREVQTILNARDSATVVINGVKAALASLNGRTATTYIDTVHRDFFHSGVQAGAPAALGRIFEFAAGGTMPAAGGWPTLPAVGDQQPQIARRDQGTILWNENRAAPWEAFISGAPGLRPRSRSIADEVVGRLGGTVAWMANGGLRGQPVPSGMPAGGTADPRLVKGILDVAERVARVEAALTGGRAHVLVDNGAEIGGQVRRTANTAVATFAKSLRTAERAG